MLNKFKSIITILLLFSLLTWYNPAFATGMIYKTQDLGKGKMKITLIQDGSQKPPSVAVTFYYLKNSKTLVVGYKNTPALQSAPSMTFDTKNALLPIRIILAKDNDRDNLPFKDIKGLESEEFIRHLHDAGIMGGDSVGNFNPTKTLSRAEFCVMLVKALNLSTKSDKTLPFKDIAKHWGRNYILAATQKGLLSGYSNKTFRPNNAISIAEACSVVSKAFKFKTKRQVVMTKLKTGKWYSPSVKSVFDMGLFLANDSIYKKFNEESPISRANAAILLSRALSTY